MSAQDEFEGRLRGLVISLDSILEPADATLVMRLIEHNEGGEAILTLAWIIVEENLHVSRQVIDDIRRLSAGLIDESELPTNLDAQVDGGQSAV